MKSTYYYHIKHIFFISVCPNEQENTSGNISNCGASKTKMLGENTHRIAVSVIGLFCLTDLSVFCLKETICESNLNKFGQKLLHIYRG